jgi:hypothetical protein
MQDVTRLDASTSNAEANVEQFSRELRDQATKLEQQDFIIDIFGYYR